MAKDELHIEGAVWLLLVDSEAFEMPEDMVHSSDTIEAPGWIVVRGRWYEKVQDSPRGYRLQKESTRCSGCQVFTSTAARRGRPLGNRSPGSRFFTRTRTIS